MKTARAIIVAIFLLLLGAISFYVTSAFLLPGAWQKFIAPLIPAVKYIPNPNPVSVDAGAKPVKGPSFTAGTFTFQFDGTEYSIEPNVANEVYYGAVEAERKVSIPLGKSRNDAFGDYYNRLAFDPLMDKAISEVCAQFRIVRDEEQLSNAAYAELITKFVQSIEYDTVRGESVGTSSNHEGDPRMPAQVLVDGKGDCDEKVLLLGALLAHEGYSVAALSFEPEQHMSLGILSDGPGYEGLGYEFIETTGPAYISEVPREFVNGVVLSSVPKVFPLGKGKKTYPFRAVQDVAYIVGARDSALQAAEAKRAEIESGVLTQSEFNSEKRRYERCFTAYNTMQVTLRKDGTQTATFKDRRTAVSWLDRYCWWFERP